MILKVIVAAKKARLRLQKRKMPLRQLMASIARDGVHVHGRFLDALKKPGLSVIAEVKKASPSRGVICEDFDPQVIAKRYEKHGADAVSVLTETDFFAGSNAYLQTVSESVHIPVLRKDFIFDIWQVYESRLIGADAILLIASILNVHQLKRFRKTANALGMDALVEVHNEIEMKKAINSGAKIIGINNRNLKTFEVQLSVTEDLMKMIPEGVAAVSESGIMSGSDARRAVLSGADAVLVGESLMRSNNIEKSLKELKQAGEKNG
ncbi:MAG: indole-3-glycerol phosphate synthase TrpC [Clostridia bacterium]|nr:indole-3-glycerol phosphate synthase TrpC [Clostridia bacterium]